MALIVLYLLNIYKKSLVSTLAWSFLFSLMGRKTVMAQGFSVLVHNGTTEQSGSWWPEYVLDAGHSGPRKQSEESSVTCHTPSKGSWYVAL